MRALAAAGLLLALTARAPGAPPAPAPAPTPRVTPTPADAARARDLAHRGAVLYDIGDFEGAIAAYLDAYRIAPDPNHLYSLAQSYRQTGNLERALFFYRSYLRNGSPEGEFRALVERRIEELAGAIRLRDLQDMPPPPEKAAETVVPAASPPAPSPPPREPPRARPIYQRWWFWAATAGVLAAATLSVVVLTRDQPGPPDSTYGAFVTF